MTLGIDKVDCPALGGLRFLLQRQPCLNPRVVSILQCPHVSKSLLTQFLRQTGA